MSQSVGVLFAVNAYPASGASARRNAAGLATILRLRKVRVVNVQPVEPVLNVHGVPTLAVLERDSVNVTGTEGPAKPVVVDLFDAAAREARAGGEQYFAFANMDIEVTQDAIDYVLAEGREAYMFSRLECDAETGAPIEYTTAGSDMFVLDVEWWLANRWRFRDYLLGEWSWDNVFTSIILCHSNGLLLNRDPYIRHECHDSGASNSPFASYTQFLAALDRPYFTLWAEYHWDLAPLRAQNAPAEAEQQLRDQTFRFRPTLRARALQLGREVKARIRFRDTLRRMQHNDGSR
jgi:hypothetical protein